MSDPCASLLTVDLNAIAENYHRLQAIAASPLAPVVKANGYGLGAVAVTRRLAQEGARSFFVARVAEGERLRRGLRRTAGIRIFVLDGCPLQSAGRLAAADLIPVLSTLEQIGAWIHAHGAALPAALHLDTGLNRLGVAPEDLDAARRLCRSARLDLVMSHLACAGSPRHPLNAWQAERFAAAASLFAGAARSLANTDGVFLGPLARSDLARPGIGLYGSAGQASSRARLKTTATLTAPLLQIRDVRRGDTVGYGGTFTAPGPMRVGVLAAGFADGVLRAAGGGGYGWFDGQPRPFIGRLSMDLIAVDLTGCATARPGDPVELFGEHARLDALARQARTVPYELLVRSAARASRRLIGRR